MAKTVNYIFNSTVGFGEMADIFPNNQHIKSFEEIGTHNYQNMSGAFENSSIEELKRFNSDKVKDMSKVFKNASKLKNICTLNTSSVLNMREMLYGCGSLTSIPTFDYTKCTDINSMFFNCYKLKSLEMKNLAIDNINTTNAFKGSALESIKFSGASTNRNAIQKALSEEAGTKWDLKVDYSDEINTYEKSETKTGDEVFVINNTLERSSKSFEAQGNTYQNLVNGVSENNNITEIITNKNNQCKVVSDNSIPLSIEEIQGNTIQNIITNPNNDEEVCDFLYVGTDKKFNISTVSSKIKIDELQGNTIQNIITNPNNEEETCDFLYTGNSTSYTIENTTSSKIRVDELIGQTHSNLIKGDIETTLVDEFEFTTSSTVNSYNSDNAVKVYVDEIVGNTVQGYFNLVTSEQIVNAIKTSGLDNNARLNSDGTFTVTYYGFDPDQIPSNQTSWIKLKSNTQYTCVCYRDNGVVAPMNIYGSTGSIGVAENFITDSTGLVFLYPSSMQGGRLKVRLVEGYVRNLGQFGFDEYDSNYIESIGELQEDGQYKVEIETCDSYNLLPVDKPDKWFLDGRDLKLVDYIDIEPNTKYCFSFDIGPMWCGIELFDSNKNSLGWVFSKHITPPVTEIFETPSNARYFKGYATIADTSEFITKKVRLNKNKDRGFNPTQQTKSNKVTFLLPYSLKAIHDTSKKNYLSDRLYWDENKHHYCIEQNIDIAIITKFTNKFETIYQHPTIIDNGNVDYGGIYLNPLKPFTSKIPHTGWGQYPTVTDYSLGIYKTGDIRCYERKELNGTLERLNSYIGDGIIIQFKVLEPKIIDLPQYNKKMFLETYTGTNYISIGNGEVEADSIKIKTDILKYDVNLYGLANYQLKMIADKSTATTPISIDLAGKVTTLTPTTGYNQYELSIKTPSTFTHNNLIIKGMGNKVKDIQLFQDTRIDSNVYVDGIQSVGSWSESDKSYKIEILSSCDYLYDKSKDLTGTSLNGNTGETIADSNKNTTDFIPVPNNGNYYINFLNNSQPVILQYDKNKKYIPFRVDGITIYEPWTWSSAFKNKKFTLHQPNTHYIRISYSTNDIDKFSVTTFNNTTYPQPQGEYDKKQILLPCQLQKIKDVADKFYYDTEKGKWCILKNIDKEYNYDVISANTGNWSYQEAEKRIIMMNFFSQADKIRKFLYMDSLSCITGLETHNGQSLYVGLNIDRVKSLGFDFTKRDEILRYFRESGFKFYRVNPVSQIIETSYTDKDLLRFNTYTDVTYITPQTTVLPTMPINSVGVKRDCMLKPSTKYTVNFNTSLDGIIDLGGTKVNVLKSETQKVITTPSTLTHSQVRIAKDLAKIRNINVFEGDYSNDYPVPYIEGINSVGSWSESDKSYKIEILSNNKNLLPNNTTLLAGFINYIEPPAENRYDACCTSIIENTHFKIGDTIHVKLRNNTGLSDLELYKISLFDRNKNLITILSLQAFVDNKKSPLYQRLVVTHDFAYYRIGIYCPSLSGGTQHITDKGLTINDLCVSKEEIDFIAPALDKKQISLPYQLQKIGDISDRFFYDDIKGKWCIEKKINEFTFDLTSGYVSQTGTNNKGLKLGYLNYPTNKSTNIPRDKCGVLCDFVTSCSYDDMLNSTTDCICANHTNGRLMYVSNKTSTEIRDFLNGKTINYILDTPQIIETEYTDPNLFKLNTYNEVTYIEPQTTILPTMNINSVGVKRKCMLKPSTQYTLNFNTSMDSEIDLGGTKVQVSANETQKVILTPSSLAHSEVRVAKTNTKVKNLNVFEGDYTGEGVIPYLEGVNSVGTYDIESGKYKVSLVNKSDNQIIYDKKTILLDEPLRKLGDVKDRLYYDKAKGHYCVERYIVDDTLTTRPTPTIEDLPQYTKKTLQAFEGEMYIEPADTLVAPTSTKLKTVGKSGETFDLKSNTEYKLWCDIVSKNNNNIFGISLGNNHFDISSENDRIETTITTGTVSSNQFAINDDNVVLKNIFIQEVGKEKDSLGEEIIEFVLDEETGQYNPVTKYKVEIESYKDNNVVHEGATISLLGTNNNLSYELTEIVGNTIDGESIGRLVTVGEGEKVLDYLGREQYQFEVISSSNDIMYQRPRNLDIADKGLTDFMEIYTPFKDSQVYIKLITDDITPVPTVIYFYSKDKEELETIYLDNTDNISKVTRINSNAKYYKVGNNGTDRYVGIVKDCLFSYNSNIYDETEQTEQIITIPCQLTSNDKLYWNEEKVCYYIQKGNESMALPHMHNRINVPLKNNKTNIIVNQLAPTNIKLTELKHKRKIFILEEQLRRLNDIADKIYWDKDKKVYCISRIINPNYTVKDTEEVTELTGQDSEVFELYQDITNIKFNNNIKPKTIKVGYLDIE